MTTSQSGKFPDWAKPLPWKILDHCAGLHGVDPNLIAAIIQTESGGIPYRIRVEPTFAYLSAPERWAGRLGITKETEIVCQKISWGPMQIMGATARDLGYEDHLAELVEWDIGVYWGTLYLATRLKKYKTVKSAIAAYNAGSVKTKKDSIEFVNQAYVDKVLARLAELG